MWRKAGMKQNKLKVSKLKKSMKKLEIGIKEKKKNIRIKIQKKCLFFQKKKKF